MQQQNGGQRRTLDVVASVKSFASLLLPPHIEQALREAGFRRPSPVQEAALPLARMGTDLIVQAKAGTGKTLVFAVAAVERVDLANAAPQVLVLAPTREIALQASEAVALVAAALPLPGLTCGSFIGGLPVEEDEKQLRRACHVVVGTTGRILSLIQRGALRTTGVRMLVLDEADKLLGDSFRKDVLAISAAVPSRRQNLALSATYAPPALEQLRRLMRGQQQEVRLCAEDTSLLGVRQCYKLVGNSSSTGSSGSSAVAGAPPAAPLPPPADGSSSSGADGGSGCGSPHLQMRLPALLQLLSTVSFQQAVVFCKYTADAEEVSERLLAAGYPAAYLSGQRSQLQRIEALNALRDFRLRVAVSTDLAARGVDLDRVNLVVNLELPGDAATYMHRVGRAGRFGTRGVAVTLLEGQEQLGRLQRYLQEVAGGQVTELPEHIPEDWYQQAIPAASASASAATAAISASGSSSARSIGPATPAAHGGPLAASLAAGSVGSGCGPLADIATASLWLLDEGGEEEEEGEQDQAVSGDINHQVEVHAAAECGATAEQLPGRHHEPLLQRQWSDSAIDVSYTVVPKPAPLGTAATASVRAEATAAAAAATAADAPAAAAGKPAVSSLTAAVAAAKAGVRQQHPTAGTGGCDSDASSADSVDSWQSTSDDDYSGSSSGSDAASAGLLAGAGSSRGVTFKPLRRIGSVSSAGSSGSSNGSGRMSSPPAPIPGRTQLLQQAQQAQQQVAVAAAGGAQAVWKNSYEEGSGLAEAVAAADASSHEGGIAADDFPAAADGLVQGDPYHPCCAGSASGDEEPSFKDSWLSEEQQQSAAAEKQQQRQGRRAEEAATAAVAGFELRPHRPKPRQAHKPPSPLLQQQQQLQQQPEQQVQKLAAQPQRDHYWDIVRSVERDVQSRLDSSRASSAGSKRASAAAPGHATSASAAAAAAEESSEEEEGGFVPTVPRQRRPLGSAQLTATRRRHEDAEACRAAEAAALEMLAEQEAEEEEQEQAVAAAAAAAGAAAGSAVAVTGEAAAAAATAEAAEQQRQWTEFWHAHYAYYGCYPSEGLFSAAGQPAAQEASAVAPAAATAAPAEAAVTAAVATLPPPPPSPPAPPPMLSGAAWACQPPVATGQQQTAAPGSLADAARSRAVAAAAATAATAEAGAAADEWVAVPAALLSRYQQLEWQQWHRQYSEWQQMWEQYKQYWHALYDQQQQQEQLEQQQQHYPQQNPYPST